MSRPRRLAVALALAMLTAAPLAITISPGAAQTASPADAAALLDSTGAGDIAPLEAALPGMRDRAGAALLRARIAATRLRHAEAEKALAAYFATRDKDAARNAAAWAIKADLAFGEGDYAGAAAAYRAALPLMEGSANPADVLTTKQALGMATLLAPEPRQAVAGGTPGRIQAARDKAGLVRGPVSIDGTAIDAVFDTGANLSVVSAATAKRLGMRILDGTASVGSTSQAEVPTRIAIAARMTIAGVELRNVAFLVIDDSALTFPLPGGYTIEAIVGYPVFRALGRVQFGRDGSFLAGGKGGRSADNLRATGNDLYVVSGINGAGATLHLDTGATTTALSSRFAALHPDLVAGLTRGKRRIAGAGGMREQEVGLWQPASVTIGGRTRALPVIQVVLGGEASTREPRLGTLGQDVLGGFEYYAIDFRTMSFELGSPVG
ncbi:aspartyl protease family protein [Sphingomonas canadensis]|uniref:Aspartyl protease family protein n=1 Tax=Sphingomonas canadensis TaxID=1219257 RepID=A0ABW3H4U1_9SPHN|nr:pepsin/retropepsin-like aspartic protease family protein [Sphingomonas canadensis]MCW3836173.1 aspartyl protease family protein [Sphingomonas canadensis]